MLAKRYTFILHDIIQITKSLKTSLSGTNLITDKYLARNFIYKFWKSRQQHYFMSSLSVVARIIESVLPEKWYNFPAWGGLHPPPPPLPRLVRLCKRVKCRYWTKIRWVNCIATFNYRGYSCYENSFAAGGVLVKTKILYFVLIQKPYTPPNLLIEVRTTWELCMFQVGPSVSP